MSHETRGAELVTAHTGEGLADAVLRLACVQVSEVSVDDLLELVVKLAREAVTDADGASITVSRQGSVETPQYSDEAVLALDHVQYETGEGPCLEALERGQVVHSSGALERWPALAERARAAGVNSVLSVPMVVRGDVLASLNLYSRAAEFDAEARQLSTMFVVPAAAALGNVMAYESAAKLNGNLREAIATREIIGEAKGILMARQACTADEAFDILRRASQRTNRKLRDIAVELVSSAERNTLPSADIR